MRQIEDDQAYQYDYRLQVWYDTRDNVILSCAHPSTMDCQCNGRKFAGLKISEVN